MISSDKERHSSLQYDIDYQGVVAKHEVATWESTKPSCRSKRNMTAGMMGIDVDSNGAPIDNRE